MIYLPKPEEKETYLNWAKARLYDAGFEDPAFPVVFLRKDGDGNDYIACVTVIHDFRWPSVMMSFVSTTPRWVSKENLRFLHDYAFNYLKCSRITALVEKCNKRARKFDEGVGFRLEGVLRKASPRGKDLCIYGMMREEFKYHVKA